MKPLRVGTAGFLIYAAFLLAGCGGGGGGGGSDSGSGTEWSAPMLLESSGLAAGVPQVAGDGAGNFMVVWRQEFAGAVNIYARLYASAGGWQTAVPLDDTTADSNLPQVAADGGGDFVVVWQQNDGGTLNIYANRYTGGAWQGREQLDDPADNSRDPQVAADRSGNFMAVWTQTVAGPLDQIYANRYTGGAWQGPELVNDVAEVSQNPQVAADESTGDFMIVWTQGLGVDVRARRHRGGWEASQVISDDDSWVPRVAADGQGNFMAVWEQFDAVDGEFGIFTSRFSGTWSVAEARDALPGLAANPTIASDGAGGFMIVWEQDDGSNQSIFGASYAGVWGAAFAVEGMGDDASIPQVAAAGGENFMVVWAHDDGGADDVWGRRYDSGSGALGSLQLIDARFDDADAPQVAGGGGRFMAVWAQGDGVNESIFASLFD